MLSIFQLVSKVVLDVIEAVYMESHSSLFDVVHLEGKKREEL